jgi:hypothetical protein
MCIDEATLIGPTVTVERDREHRNMSRSRRLSDSSCSMIATDDLRIALLFKAITSAFALTPA